MKHRFLYIMALLLTVATGAWAQDPDPIDLTPSADGTVWTLSTMPEYDVELEVTYYTDAELDQMAADEVIAKITAIGTVTYTPESKALIDAARTAYDALTAAQQALVTNYSTLTDAETTYATAEETAYTEGVELTKNPDGTWTLAATPAFDVELEVEYETAYAVNVAEGIENGDISVAPAEAAAGDEVTVTATPAEGYELASVSVTGIHEDVAVVVTDGKFTMPADDVTVNASFQKKVVYIETDLTKDFISLVSPASWKSENASPVGQATWAAPQVTVAGNKYYMIENYVEGQTVKQATGGVMYNEITGLTPGLYTIELYGSAALTAGRSDMTTDFAEGDAASLSAVYLYAESNGEKVKKFIPCLIEEDFKNRGGEESIPTATLDNVVVGNDGKIKIGIYKEVGLTNWHIVQLKSVTAKVAAADLLAKAVSAADAIKEDDVPESLYSRIRNAIATYDKEFGTADEYLAAIEALNGLADEAAGYAPLAKILNEGKGYKANVPAEDPAIAAYDAAIADVKNAYDNAAVADIPAAVAVIEDALPALAKAQTAPNSDMTRAIVNPAINGVSGWTCERPKGGGGPELPAGGALEFWAGQPEDAERAERTFDYYQVIEGLTSGKYVVSVGMYNSLNGEAGAVFSPTCGVYASSGNDETAKLVDVEGTEYIPYTTETVFVRDGKLRLGVKSAETPMAARWFVADNFKLTLVEAIKTYPITYANGMVGGSVSGPVAAAAEEKVTLAVTPEEGYATKSLKVTCADSGNEINYDITDYSFTMPAEGVKVFAEFVRVYSIIYADGMVGGKVEGPVAASADTEIDLVVTPDEGYTLKTLKITCADSGNEINYDVTDYSFTMPAEDVKIFAEFGKVYSIAYPVGTQGGTVAGSTSAFAGDKVKLNVVPNEGYELESLTITCDNSGNEINYDVVDFSFTMPEEGVHVFATFQPSSKVEIAHGIATYCSLKNLDFTNEDVKAYIVSAFTPSTGEAVLTRVYDVPAGTGLVLIGENGSYEIPEGTGATVVSNLLKGVTSATVLNAVDETNTNFILTTGEYDLGFYPVLDGTTLAAGKAYLPLPTESLPLSAGAAIRFVFEDRGEATYINGVAIGYAGSKMEKGVYYNLNGQRVGRPAKGGIYILDGKKVYVK